MVKKKKKNPEQCRWRRNRVQGSNKGGGSAHAGKLDLGGGRTFHNQWDNGKNRPTNFPK